MRDKLRLGPDERGQLRDIVSVTAGLALWCALCRLGTGVSGLCRPGHQANRKQLITNALKALASGTRTKDAVAVLDALEMLDGDRIEPTRSRGAQEG